MKKNPIGKQMPPIAPQKLSPAGLNMTKWIKKTHLIYATSFILFGFSLFSTSKWTTHKEKSPLVFSNSNFQLEIKRYPFSLDVKNKLNNHLIFNSLKLTDENNHIIPLDYLIEPKKRFGRSYASSQGLNHESYSFIVSSHMRKDLRYRVTFKTKNLGINVSLFPMNIITKKFSMRKNLKLTIHDNNLINAASKKVVNLLDKVDKVDKADKDKSTFFQSEFFTINKIKDKVSHLKINKFYKNISLSSANNEMFFSLNFSNTQVKMNDAKVTYQSKSLK